MSALLIRVFGKEITTERFELACDACKKMSEEWDELLKGEPDDIDAGMNNMDAWIENGKDNQDYTWKVVRI